MIRKKTKPVDQYAFLTISLNTFSSAVNMSVNGQARDRRQDNDNVSLYCFGSSVLHIRPRSAKLTEPSVPTTM